ncbi:hypothetical protein TI04_12145 [Achromatium sp. WMS2]|nr:hypothetical protein TI04_12145 [Achromatium sp. WMS2]
MRSGLLDPQTESQCSWTLHHDYLARLIITTHRYAARWQRFLQARSHTFYTVTGLRSRWQALLSPWEQLRLLFETQRGQVNLENHGIFLILSTAKVIPFILALLLALSGTNLVLDWQARNAADLVLSNLNNTYKVTASLDGDALRQFWVLAAANQRFKTAFVQRSLANANSQTTLVNHMEMLNQSLFGLDPQFRQRRHTLNLILTDLNRRKNSQITPYSALLAATIYATGPEVFGIATGSTVIQYLTAAMRATNDGAILSILGMTLGKLSVYSTPEQVKDCANRLVTNMLANSDRRQIIQIGQALNSLEPKLPALQAQMAAELYKKYGF